MAGQSSRYSPLRLSNVPDVLLLQEKVKCQFVSIDMQSISLISDKQITFSMTDGF